MLSSYDKLIFREQLVRAQILFPFHMFCFPWEGAWMTSQLGHNFQAFPAVHWADDIMPLNFLNTLDI